MTNLGQNFFSTQFVNQVPTADQSVRLTVTSNWWIFLAASLPLTAVTLYIWWFYVQKQAYGHYPSWWNSVSHLVQAAFLRISKRRRRLSPQSSNSRQEGSTELRS
jgi:hypothetical protein